MKTTKTLKTFLGEKDIEFLYKSSLGYFAVTGTGLSQRSWMITKAEYDNLKKEA